MLILFPASVHYRQIASHNTGTDHAPRKHVLGVLSIAQVHVLNLRYAIWRSIFSHTSGVLQAFQEPTYYQQSHFRSLLDY